MIRHGFPAYSSTDLSGRQLAHALAALDPSDPIRHKHESLLLEKLYDMGILGTAGAGGKGKLSEVEKKVTVSSMCRRRLGVVMTRLKMADTVQAVGNHPLLITTLHTSLRSNHSWPAMRSRLLLTAIM
jgi:U3 small nucleolar ribonucleoprotein protein IMP3